MQRRAIFIARRIPEKFTSPGKTARSGNAHLLSKKIFSPLLKPFHHQVMLKILPALFILFLPGMSLAQSYDEIIGFSLEKNDIKQYLPPLNTVLDSAEKNSPLLKMYDSDIIIQELTIKSQKREWMQSLGFEAGVKYGLFDNLVISQDLGVEDLATLTTEQSRYNLGFSLKIPLSLIADKSELRMAREEKNKLIYEKAGSLTELRKLIIVQYYNILKAHKKIVLNTQQVESFRIQVMRAEKEYENGIINTTEYARLSNMFSNALLELEESKLEFYAAIRLLGESAGMNINLLT